MSKGLQPGGKLPERRSRLKQYPKLTKEQQKLGWQSNLVGFALKELPRVLTEPARRRNRYLDDLVLGTPSIAQNAYGGATGQATGNYSML